MKTPSEQVVTRGALVWWSSRVCGCLILATMGYNYKKTYDLVAH